MASQFFRDADRAGMRVFGEGVGPIPRCGGDLELLSERGAHAADDAALSVSYGAQNRDIWCASACELDNVEPQSLHILHCPTVNTA